MSILKYVFHAKLMSVPIVFSCLHLYSVILEILQTCLAGEDC